MCMTFSYQALNKANNICTVTKQNLVRIDVILYYISHVDSYSAVGK